MRISYYSNSSLLIGSSSWTLLSLITFKYFPSIIIYITTNYLFSIRYPWISPGILAPTHYLLWIFSPSNCHEIRLPIIICSMISSLLLGTPQNCLILHHNKSTKTACVCKVKMTFQSGIHRLILFICQLIDSLSHIFC